MKARFALVAIAMLVAAPLAAQGGGGGGGMRMGGGAPNVESLTTLYSLSTEQQAKAKHVRGDLHRGHQGCHGVDDEAA